MGVNLSVTSQKFYNQFKNGETFSVNLADYTPNLTGSIMENVQYVQEVDISWGSSASAANPFTIVRADPIFTFTQASGNWLNDGWGVGDTGDITFFDNTTAGLKTYPFTVVSVDGTTLVLNIPAFLPADSAAALPIDLQGTTPLTASVYKFGLIENADPFAIQSLVSGNDQGYYSGSIGLPAVGPRSTAFQTGQRLGQYEDWRTGGMEFRYVSNPTPYIQRYEIKHEFTIVPFYLDGQLSNLQNGVIPTLLNGVSSLKYVFNPSFRSALSNPNGAKEFQYEQTLGSVAWFGENFNGFNNEYNIKSIAYADAVTLASADGLLVSSRTRVTITVENTTNPFTGLERYDTYISYLPSQAEYTNTKLTDLKDNFIYANTPNNEGTVLIGGANDIIKVTTASISSGDLVIVIDVEYSATQKAFLAGKVSAGPTRFLIGVGVGDDSLTSASSDRVVLLADVEEYDESADIPDLMAFDKFDIYAPNEQISGGNGTTSMISWNEDGLVVDYDFYIDTNKQAVLNSLDFKLVAYDPVTFQYSELDSFSFGVSSAIVSGGIQQIIETKLRGYDLEAGDQFNDMTITVGPNVGGLQHYTGRYAQKISWQDWLSNLNIDPVFFDATKPNDNLNFKASNYSLLNGYEIRFLVAANLTGVSTLAVTGDTDYIFPSPTVTVYDYDLDAENPSTPIFSCVIETFTADGLTNLGGAILTGADTLFRTTWTKDVGGPFTTLVDLWAFHRIEETQQAGYEIQETNTLTDSPSNTLLIPTTSNTRLDMDLVTGEVVTECLINGSNVKTGIGYNISARLHDDAFVILPKDKITSPLNEVKDTSGGAPESKEFSP